MDNTFETKIPANKIGEAELTAMLLPLAERSGVGFVIEKQYVVISNDAEFDELVDRIKDMILRNAKPAKVKKESKSKKNTHNVPAEKQKLGLHSYRREDTGEIVSKQKINKMLAEHELAVNTVFTNSRGRFLVGKVDDSQDGPFQLIAEGEQA
jgi:hypothetical protein